MHSYVCLFFGLFIRIQITMAAAEVNGSSATPKEEEEPMDVTATHTENYQTLIDAGLPQKVAESLDNIFQTGGGDSRERCRAGQTLRNCELDHLFLSFF